MLPRCLIYPKLNACFCYLISASRLRQDWNFSPLRMGGGEAANLGVVAGPSFGAWPSGLVDQVERREKDQAYVGQLPRLECRSVDDTASSLQGTVWLVLNGCLCGLLSPMGRVSRDASGRG